MFTIALSTWRPGVTKYGNIGVELLQEARAKNPGGLIFPTREAAQEACKQLYDVVEARWRNFLISDPDRDPSTVKPLGCPDVYEPVVYMEPERRIGGIPGGVPLQALVDEDDE